MDTGPIEPTFDIEAARKVIENEKQDRARRIKRKLDELMAEERFTLAVVPMVIIDGQPAQVAIVPQD